MSDVKPGLEGVVAGETAICSVRAEEGQLIYRGYDVHELAEEARFEEVAYLVLFGKLPSRDEFDAFDRELKANRSLPAGMLESLALFPSDAVPMDGLRTAVSGLALYDPDAEDNSHAANSRKATRLVARMATVVAALHRLSQGLDVIAPDPELNHTANFLYMLRGKRPDEFEAKVLEVTLILYMEHEFNASTFTARVIASTLSDLYGAVVGAIAALKGPLHGGANEKAMDVILEIGDPARAEGWVRESLQQKKRIMGFGHRIYKKADSRVELAKKWGGLLGKQLDDTRFNDICTTVEDVMRREKNLFPNVDFYAAPIYYMMKIPTGLNTPIFAMSRVIGWSAHVIEQIENNRLFRPNSRYIGPEGLKFEPLEKRA
jgi:citrate synthase